MRQIQVPRSARIHLPGKHRRMLGLVLVIAGLALVGVQAIRIAAAARSLQIRIARAQALAQSGAARPDMAEVQDLLLGLRSDVTSLRASTRSLLWLAPHLGWLPGVGGDVEAAPALLETADGLTEAGVLIWKALSPLSKALGPGNGVSAAQNVLAQLSLARPQLVEAREALARAAAARSAIRTDRLSPRLADPLSKLDRVMPLAQAAVDMAIGAPEAMGQNNRRTYLILAQNEDELRPTGG